MSLFGSLTTAISGLNAQAAALANISDNVSNSQTVGFKRVDTNFQDFLTVSNDHINEPGATVARPDYRNDVQGAVAQSDNPLAMAISGNGFFSVVQQTGSATGAPAFGTQQLYTRAGDFRMNRDGYLTNGAGYALQGWTTSAAGVTDRSKLGPIQVNQQVLSPVPTGRIALSANLPADSTTTAASSQAQAYDSLGRLHNLAVSWTNLGPNRWQLAVNSPDDAGAPARGTVEVDFGSAATPPTADGTVGRFTNPTGSLTATSGAAGSPATVSFTSDFGQGAQPLQLSLGAFGSTSGLTQYAGTEYSVRSLTQDGVAQGGFTGVSVRENGDLAVNYDNGQTRLIGRVPVVAFNDPDRLQRLNGQAFARTTDSGEARVTDANANGAGSLTVGSLERSNVDIATEFSKLIVAQRAYTANTKIVTTTDEMLQDTINMRR